MGTFVCLNTILILSGLVCLMICLLWLNWHYRFKYLFVFGFALQFGFFLTGFLLFQLHNKQPEFFSKGKSVAMVMEILQDKPNSYQSVVRIYAVVKNDSIFPVNEKVLMWFEKDTTSEKLRPGTTILFEKVPEVITNKGNPFEFNYQKYMQRKKIYRQVYLASEYWKPFSIKINIPIRVKAEQIRLQLLNVFNNRQWEKDVKEVISALVLGYKQGLDKDVKHAFTAAGAIHLLAVSGLHVGIIYVLLTFLLQFLKSNPKYKIFFVLIVISLLWFFALITGMSPSVKRAATMFSFVVVGQNLHKQVNIYNSLAASAFILLLFNPNNLFDAGFQLSYCAVFGIVFLQPKLELLYRPKYKITSYLWSLFTVSVAAQLSTFPISAFYFNQFPVYFWVSNLVAVPAVTLIIPLSLTFLAFSWIPHVTNFISVAIAACTGLMIDFLKWIENLPFSVIDVYFSPIEMLLMSTFILAVFYYSETSRLKKISNTLYIALIYIFISLMVNINSIFRKEVIIYNSQNDYIVHVIAGKKNYIISKDTLVANDINILRNTVRGMRLAQPVFFTYRDSFNDSIICLKNQKIRINKLLLQLPTESNVEQKYLPENGIVVKNLNPQVDINNNASEVIIVSRYPSGNQLHATLYNLTKNGAFHINW